jgi:fibronectin type 3 domain-containing protein
MGGAAFVHLGSPMSETAYSDRQVEQGRKYAYRVQALLAHDKGLVGGGFSRAVESTPADQTPPQPPLNVKAARTASAVKVYWDKGTENDLAGYRVYRRIGEAAPEMIGEVKEPNNLFEDKNAPEKGVKLSYLVSSIDQNDPPNESQKSAEASVR